MSKRSPVQEAFEADQRVRTLAPHFGTSEKKGATPMVSTTERPKTDAKQTKKLVGGGNPDSPFNPPGEELFLADGVQLEFLEADSLRNLASLLIERKTALKGCRGHAIQFAWKRKGGQLNKAPKYGRAERLNAKERWLAADDGFEWLVWLAADHLNGATAFQVEAELFDALCMIGESEKGTPAVNPPDFIGYHPAIQEYGTWREEIRVLSEQLRFEDIGE